MNNPELPLIIKDRYYQIVWKIVRLIPLGKVTTYGYISSLIPCPNGSDQEEYKIYRARWVGNALSVCPQGVPWQRVLNSQGKISYRQSGEQQKRILLSEGIDFGIHERVDLKKFGWEGPSHEWIISNGLITTDNSH